MIHIQHLNKDCGYVVVDDNGKKIFHTRRDPKKHLFQKWQAFGVSESVLKRCERMGVDEVWIHTNSNVLKYSLDEFLNSKLIAQFDEADKQLFVSLNWELNQ
jgi:ribulose 1,5-bisphosphate carboxylase large subunit-like protein